MGKNLTSDLVHSYLSPEGHDEGPSTSLISIRVHNEIKEELSLLASVLATKPSPLAAELFILALKDAIKSLPPQMASVFDDLEMERNLSENRR